MSECNNLFEEFVKRFYIKYDKLQIEGFHCIASRTHRSVSPTKKMQNLFSMNQSRMNRLHNNNMSFIKQHTYESDTKEMEDLKDKERLLEAVNDIVKPTEEEVLLNEEFKEAYTTEDK